MRDIHNLLLLGPEFLEFPEVQKVHTQNKAKILKFIDEFREANGGRNDFYLLGSSALVLQDLLYKRDIRDIDIHSCGNILVKTDNIDFISDFLLPEGWKNRVQVVDGVNVVSKRDIICSIAGSNLAKAKRLEARATLKILMAGEDPQTVRQDLEALLLKNKTRASDTRYELYTKAYNEFIALCESEAFVENAQSVLFQAMKNDCE